MKGKFPSQSQIENRVEVPSLASALLKLERSWMMPRGIPTKEIPEDAPQFVT